ncbi:membrane protein [Lentilactobacillus fungorum]|uniref:Membrane protein n=1 Tax=Lentilactobacillus fungorum TaxID=2201250 RepID=A0ABQ3W274_9LACO|nr:PDZ domain-containing protein [Lentilactobacillus fungorum]GHP15163.1 membrane protein [Lentilactobacillus fungorum]
MKIILAIGFYILQPALWVGLIRSYLIYHQRIKRERKLFNSAIYEDFYEGRHFVRGGLILGISVSVLLGWFLTVSVGWLILYQLLVLILLIIVPNLIAAVTAMALASLLILNLPSLAFLDPIEDWLGRLGLMSQVTNPLSYLVLMTVTLLLTGLFIRMNAGKFDSPTIARNTRHTKVAVYRFNELTLIPLLLFVPGDWFSSDLSFIPFFQIAGHRYAILIIPFLLGLKLTVRKSVPRQFFLNLSQTIFYLVILGLGLIVISQFYPQMITPSLAILLGGYYIVIGLAKYRDRQVNFEYSEVMDGIRVIGIQPGTPAAKMDLKIGDVILSVNGVNVANEDEFYRALSTNATYCRFKVRDRNDQLKMTESAIFKNSPHEIGVKTYTQAMK